MKIFVHVLTAATATCRCATTARLSTSSCSLTSCLAFALNSNSPCFLIRDRSLLADSCLRFLGSGETPSLHAAALISRWRETLSDQSWV